MNIQESAHDRKMTPLMRQYHAIKKQHKDSLVFFRLGDFYELFYDDAVIAARELDLVLTTRDRDRPDPVPMCGIPWFAAEGYIQRLIQKGYKVALCEQTEDPSQAKGLVKRAVTRVITPGTFVGPEDSPSPVILAAMVIQRNRIGLAWLDLVTGDGESTELSLDQGVDHRLADLWNRSRATELLYPESWSRERIQQLQQQGVQPSTWTPVPDWVFDARYAREVALRVLNIDTLEAFDLERHEIARIAFGTILHYLEETQKFNPSHLRQYRYTAPEDHMVLDAVTVRNLELLQNAYDGSRKGTLVQTIDRTQTPMGRRLLESWILNPLLNISQINDRLDAVESLYRSPTHLVTLRNHLQGIPDMERIASRIALGQAGPRDLALLRQGLTRLPPIWDDLRSIQPAGVLAPVTAHPDLLESLAELLTRALADDPPAVIRDPGVIRDGYNEKLDNLRHVARDSRQLLVDMEQQERRRTGIPNLRIRFNKVFGYYIEVTKSYLDRIPSDYERRQTLTQAERYTTPELKQFEETILNAEETAFNLEQELFRELLEHVQSRLTDLQVLSSQVALIDVIQGFADTALRRRYTRPHLDYSSILNIVKGRHPVIEATQTDQPFIPNDTFLAEDTRRILVLTGPNMGGKSTYLRQVALITLMAQMGSFVPAEKAHIGLVNKIFTRVGASDYLTRAQSTFMVEMLETAYILRHATPNSLIILDEIGRGTSTFDGMAIAWAVLEYLHENWTPSPRTLFATHFHELIHLAELYPQIENASVAVKEAGDKVVFLYRVVPGPCDQSYGIHVASLAGVPAPVIEQAHTILRQLSELESILEKTIDKVSGKNVSPTPLTAIQRISRRQVPRLVQRSLFEVDPLYRRFQDFVEELKQLNLEDMSPLQAWQYLERLQQLLCEKSDP